MIRYEDICYKAAEGHFGTYAEADEIAEKNIPPGFKSGGIALYGSSVLIEIACDQCRGIIRGNGKGA